MKKVGIITIGQSPRPDVIAEMSPFFGENIAVLERGALDGLDLEQVSKLAPNNGLVPYCTRMSDGTEVLIAKEKILPLIKSHVSDLNKEDVSAILLLCVGSFPQFESQCLVVYPQRIVNRCVESLIDDTHHLGIIIPVPGQKIWAINNFSHITPSITVTDASPYGDPARISHAGQVLRDAGCDLIVMYCMGFTRELTKEIRILTGKPVILSSSIAARIIGEIME